MKNYGIKLTYLSQAIYHILLLYGLFKNTHYCFFLFFNISAILITVSLHVHCTKNPLRISFLLMLVWGHAYFQAQQLDTVLYNASFFDKTLINFQQHFQFLNTVEKAIFHLECPRVIHLILDFSYCMFYPLCVFTFFYIGFQSYDYFRRFLNNSLAMIATLSIIYIVFPVAGPRLSTFSARETGTLFSTANQFFYSLADFQGCAFPSCHVASVLVFSFFVFKVKKVLGILYGIILIGIMVETIRGGYHYIVDILAGFLFGMFWLIFASDFVRSGYLKER